MKIGKGVNIHSTVQIFGDDIEIGDNVRIDAFSILTGKLRIGSNIHIACYSFLSGGEGITLEDFSEFAPRTTILTASDDYKGFSLVGPTIPMRFKPRCQKGAITVKRHALLGANCVVLPGVTIGEGSSAGAFSLISRDMDSWGIYAGIPAKRIGDRSRDMLRLEKEFTEWQQRAI